MTQVVLCKVLIAIQVPETIDEAFGVVVPHIPGCFSAGDTLEAALKNASEAIEGHTELEPATCDRNLADTAIMLEPPEELADSLWRVITAPVTFNHEEV